MAVYYLAIIGSLIITYIIFSIKQSHISKAIWLFGYLWFFDDES
jgi:hypothetical protein